MNIISNTFGEHAFSNSFNYGTINFDPIEKIVQLQDEKIALYERMLKEKMIVILLPTKKLQDFAIL